MRMNRSRAVRVIACVATVAAAALTGVQASSASPTATSQAAALRAQLRDGSLSQSHGVYDVCKANKLPCLAQVVTDGSGSKTPLTSDTPLGYGATELEKIYGVSNAPSANGTIAVIGVGADPKLESDLARYRSTYGLPACARATGCFKQINYLGGKPYKPAHGGFRSDVEQDLSVETSLDVDMASAACPGCKIVSIQLPLNDVLFEDKAGYEQAINHFATGVNTAHGLGYSAVSISYGYPATSYSDSPKIEALMRQPGMAIVTSSGDSGLNYEPYFNTWPQGIPTVTVAGGTSVYPDSSTKRGYLEQAWNGAGSGCQPDEPPAVGQPASISSLCNKGSGRTYSDMSAIADPYTGVAVFDSFAYFGAAKPLRWIVVGGTSASSPFIGGLYARAPRNSNVIGPNTIYADPASDFNDITIGTNFGLNQCGQFKFGNAVCDAGPGWDGPTGVGTPKGLAPFGG